VLDIAEMIRHELIDVDMGHSITEAELAKRGELGNKSPELIHAALAYELGIGLVKRINPGTAAEPFRYYDPGTSTG